MRIERRMMRFKSIIARLVVNSAAAHADDIASIHEGVISCKE
ncbi:MAG: hypothetical protein QW416_08880 [Candidatus Nitrosocaldaceae archaeon]